MQNINIQELFDKFNDQISHAHTPQIVQSIVVKLQFDCPNELFMIKSPKQEYLCWLNALKQLTTKGWWSQDQYELTPKSINAFFNEISSIVKLKNNSIRNILYNINSKENICNIESIKQLYKETIQQKYTRHNLLRMLAVLSQVENVPFFVIVEFLRLTQSYDILFVILHEIGCVLPNKLVISGCFNDQLTVETFSNKNVQCKYTLQDIQNAPFPNLECKKKAIFNGVKNFKDIVEQIFTLDKHKPNAYKNTKILLYIFSNSRILNQFAMHKIGLQLGLQPSKKQIEDQKPSEEKKEIGLQPSKKQIEDQKQSEEKKAIKPLTEQLLKLTIRLQESLLQIVGYQGFSLQMLSVQNSVDLYSYLKCQYNLYKRNQSQNPNSDLAKNNYRLLKKFVKHYLVLSKGMTDDALIKCLNKDCNKKDTQYLQTLRQKLLENMDQFFKFEWEDNEKQSLVTDVAQEVPRHIITEIHETKEKFTQYVLSLNNNAIANHDDSNKENITWKMFNERTQLALELKILQLISSLI